MRYWPAVTTLFIHCLNLFIFFNIGLSSFELIWPIKPSLKQSTVFLTQRTKIQIPPIKSLTRPITIIQSRVPTSVSVGVSIAVKERHYHSNYCNGNIQLGWLTVQSFSLFSSCWYMMTCQQTWCWRRSWEFYILILKKQEINYVTGYTLFLGDLKANLHSDILPPTRSHLLQQSPTS